MIIKLFSDLLRCLGLGDLTFLSLGAMIGVGIYVTMGQITREAGPSIVLSYFFAGVVSVLSALCYAGLSDHHVSKFEQFQQVGITALCLGSKSFTDTFSFTCLPISIW